MRRSGREMADAVEDFGRKMRVDGSSKKKKGGGAKKRHFRDLFFFSCRFLYIVLLKVQVERTQRCQAGEALR